MKASPSALTYCWDGALPKPHACPTLNPQTKNLLVTPALPYFHRAALVPHLQTREFGSGTGLHLSSSLKKTFHRTPLYPTRLF